MLEDEEARQWFLRCLVAGGRKKTYIQFSDPQVTEAEAGTDAGLTKLVAIVRSVSKTYE